MNINDIKNFKNDAAKLIAEGSLHKAFAMMRAFCVGDESYDLTSAIDRQEQNYAYMLRYMAQGIDDPGREAILADIVAEARAIVDSLARAAFMKENPTLYYSTLRSLNMRRAESIAGLAAQYIAEMQRLDQDFDNIADHKRTRRAEQLLCDLFNRIWVAHPLRSDDLAAMADFLRSQFVSTTAACAVVAAATLGALEFYDHRRIRFLLETYLSAEDEVGLRALTGFCLAMFRYRQRQLHQSISKMLNTAQCIATWETDIKAVAIELMRTRDTERINSRLSGGLLSTLSRMAPELKDKIGDEPINVESLMEGGNPEWEEMFAKSGMADTLREMSKIQADGGDIYMSSFSNLKHFPFFGEIANWFLPFDSSHSAVLENDNFEGSLSSLLSRLPFLCDSDKYSIMFSLGTVPQAQHDTLMQALNAQGGQMHEMLSEAAKADPDMKRKAAVANYVRDLFRFFRLFRRKGEFFDPFAHDINILELSAIASVFNDLDTIEVVAEFCVKHQLWSEACSLLTKVDAERNPDSARAQKIAFCLDNLGQYAQAISHYEEAEMLGDNSAWLMGRMARAFRRLDNPLRAIEYYKRAVASTPDDLALLIELANTLLEAGKADEAEPLYFKAIYLAPENISARRGLAWAQFVCCKFEAADASYAHLLANEDEIIAEDLLNAAHTARARGEIKRAIGLYRRYVDRCEGGAQDLLKALANDRRWLVGAGVDTSQNKLIVEALLYGSDKE